MICYEVKITVLCFLGNMPISEVLLKMSMSACLPGFFVKPLQCIFALFLLKASESYQKGNTGLMMGLSLLEQGSAMCRSEESQNKCTLSWRMFSLAGPMACPWSTDSKNKSTPHFLFEGLSANTLLMFLKQERSRKARLNDQGCYWPTLTVKVALQLPIANHQRCLIG